MLELFLRARKGMVGLNDIGVDRGGRRFLICSMGEEESFVHFCSVSGEEFFVLWREC